MTSELAHIIIAAIAALPGLIVSIAALLKVIKTHDIVNQRMTDLLELTKAQAIEEVKRAQHEKEVSGGKN